MCRYYTFFFSSRHLIVYFSLLRLDHDRLPAHYFYLSPNDSLYCTRHDDPVKCDFPHLLFCPSIFSERLSLHNLFFFCTQYPIFFILVFLYPKIFSIKAIIFFFLQRLFIRVYSKLLYFVPLCFLSSLSTYNCI